MQQGRRTAASNKSLPVASGIGGGSADAAAALRLLTRLWSIDPAHAAAVAPALGADVPACLLSMTARGDGAGDELTLVDDPESPERRCCWSIRASPLSTGEVFAALGRRSTAARSATGATGRNDLEAPAIAHWSRRSATCSPGLRAQPGANFVRMSGSGATCFALFDERGRARRGRRGLSRDMVASGDLSALRRRR